MLFIIHAQYDGVIGTSLPQGHRMMDVSWWQLVFFNFQHFVTSKHTLWV